MAPGIKMIVTLNLLWSKFAKTNSWATFRSASTDLDHALVVCDLTQIPHLYPDPSAGINYLQLRRIMQVKSSLVSFLNYLEKISNMHHDSGL